MHEVEIVSLRRLIVCQLSHFGLNSKRGLHLLRACVVFIRVPSFDGTRAKINSSRVDCLDELSGYPQQTPVIED